MAIDDNTSYELTGAQVKDLASKIKAKADSSSLATVATSGSYADLSNKPTIPTVSDGTLTIQQNGTTVGTFTANQSSATTVSLTDTTYSAFTGTDGQAAGSAGLVPAPATTDAGKFLKADGTWGAAGGSSTIIYYANSTSDRGFPATTSGPYIYKDSARTTLATPGEIYNNFQAGNPIHIEYESTQTGTSAFNMTLEVTTMSFTGGDTYSMIVNEVTGETGYPTRDLVMLRLYTTWDGQSTFLGRWYLHRRYVNDGTLTIQHNGTTKGTFTANQSTASTVNIETIYADTPGTATTPAASVQASDIVWSTMPFNYSTTEFDTGFTWIDGKHIYKKTINTGQIPSGSSMTTFDISGLNLDKLIKLEGRCMEPTSGNCRVMPNVARTLEDMIRVDVQSRNTLRIITAANSDWSGYSESTVTLWYTKTS